MMTQLKPWTTLAAAAALTLALVGCNQTSKATASTAAALPPPVGLASTNLSPSSTTITAPGVVTLTATTDLAPVVGVQFYRVKGTTRTLIYTDTTPPYSVSFAFSSALQSGTYRYVAKAYNNTMFVADYSPIALITVNIPVN